MASSVGSRKRIAAANAAAMVVVNAGPLGVSQTCFTKTQQTAALSRIDELKNVLKDSQTNITVPLDVFMEVLAYLDCKKDAVVNPSSLNHPRFTAAAESFLSDPTGLPQIKNFITRVKTGEFKKHIMSLKALAERNIIGKGEPVCFFVHRTVGELNEQLAKGYTVYKGEPYPVPLPFLKWLKKDSGPSLSMLRDGYPGTPVMNEVFSYDSTFDPGARLKVGDTGVFFDNISIKTIPPKLINAFGYGQVIDSITFENIEEKGQIKEDHVRIIITKKKGAPIILNRKTKSYGNVNSNELNFAIGNPEKNNMINRDSTSQDITNNLVIVKELGDGTQGMMASLNAGTQNIEYAVGTADEIVTLRSRLMLVGVLLLLSAEKEYANIGRVTYYSPIVEQGKIEEFQRNNAKKAMIDHNNAYINTLNILIKPIIIFGQQQITGKLYIDLASDEIREVQQTAYKSFIDFITDVQKAILEANKYIEEHGKEPLERYKQLCEMGKACHIFSDIRTGPMIGSNITVVIGKMGSTKRLFSPLFTPCPFEGFDYIYSLRQSSRIYIQTMISQSTLKHHTRKAPRNRAQQGGSVENPNNIFLIDYTLNPTKYFYGIIKGIAQSKLVSESSDNIFEYDLDGNTYESHIIDDYTYDIYQYLLPYFSWLGYTCLDRETLDGLIIGLYTLGYLNSTHQNFMVVITMDEFRTLFYSLRLPAMEQADEATEASEQAAAYAEMIHALLNARSNSDVTFSNLLSGVSPAVASAAAASYAFPIPPAPSAYPVLEASQSTNSNFFRSRSRSRSRNRSRISTPRSKSESPKRASPTARADRAARVARVANAARAAPSSPLVNYGGRRTVKKRRRNKTLKKRKYNRKTKRHA